MKIEFFVESFPPKKDGASSMWGKNNEAPRIIKLRERALSEKKKMGLQDSFKSSIALEISIYIPRSQFESIGDLDNFITGICDGLQAAPHNALPYLHEIFKKPGYREIDPKKAILIDNDSRVTSIKAQKIGIPEDQEGFYRISISDELSN